MKKGKNQKIKKLSKEKNLIDKNNILDYLISPIKFDYQHELWSIKEIAIFECCLCLFGKRFDFISRILKKEKKLIEIYEFYQIWK